MTTVSERVAAVIAAHTDEVFALMGNGNAHVVDALAREDVRLTAVRHETATVASADAYFRVSRRLAVATTTYGPGYTNALTSLAEAAQARTPLVLVVGDAPTTGARPWDIDQAAAAAALGAPTITVSAAHAGRSTRDALQRALDERTAVVLAIPYDLGAAPAAAEPAGDLILGPRPAPLEADPIPVERIAAVLAEAERPLILAGRGARDAREALSALADRLGALTISSAPARGTFAGRPYDLGVSGGFASESSAALMTQADVVLAVGAGLNNFTMSFGDAVSADTTLAQIDILDAATNPRVDLFLSADAGEAIRALDAALPDTVTAPEKPWGGSAEAARDSRTTFEREPDTELADDGLLDPRAVMRALDEILPETRQVISDGGHFIGWANSYFRLPAPDAITLVGTAFQSIGLGFPSAAGAVRARPDHMAVLVTGDGGGLMGLADLDTLVRVAESALVLVFNDAGYGAEVHQYGSQGLDERIMRIDRIDFAALATGFGARSAVIDRLADLDAVRDWVADGARGTFVADLRVSDRIVAPYIQEIIAKTIKRA